MRKTFNLGAAILLGGMALAQTAAAQSFPEAGKNITIIVPTAAGGSTDVGTRIVAAEMEKLLGVPVQVANKPGASGIIGLTEMARANPDGYTLSAFAVIAHVAAYVDQSRKPTFGRADIQPVGAFGMDDLVLTVKADSAYATVADLVAAAKAAPGGVKVAFTGVGAGPHLCWVKFEASTGTDLTFVQFDGGTAMDTAVAGGHIDASIGSIAGAASLMQAGVIRPLGVTGAEPNETLPEVPTLVSQGVDVVYSARYGLAAPAGVPQDIIATLAGALATAVANPEVQAKLRGAGMTPRYLDAAAYAEAWTAGETLVAEALAAAARDRHGQP
ncbi:MAG: tripartite tricarboxylate transporter substrate binding protein [Rhodobacteraceae bacterium]|nr:tripartite tricarboxylate transporter substrate binding protein [Paracoccaceae bacterium]